MTFMKGRKITTGSGKIRDQSERTANGRDEEARMREEKKEKRQTLDQNTRS